MEKNGESFDFYNKDLTLMQNPTIKMGDFPERELTWVGFIIALPFWGIALICVALIYTISLFLGTEI